MAGKARYTYTVIASIRKPRGTVWRKVQTRHTDYEVAMRELRRIRDTEIYDPICGIVMICAPIG